MAKKLSDMTDVDFAIEMLTLQYIQGRTADSALEYVKLYKQTKEEIKTAYKGTEKPFNINPLIN